MNKIKFVLFLQLSIITLLLSVLLYYFNAKWIVPVILLYVTMVSIWIYPLFGFLMFVLSIPWQQVTVSVLFFETNINRALFFSWFAASLARFRINKYTFNMLDFWVILFIMSGFIHILQFKALVPTVKRLLPSFFAGLTYFGVRLTVGRREVPLAVKGMVLSGIVPIMIGFYGVIQHSLWGASPFVWPGSWRVFATFLDYNFYGSFLAAWIPLVYAWMIHGRYYARLLPLFCLFIIASAQIIWTGSRGAWLALLASLTTWKNKWLPIAGFILIVFILLLAVSGPFYGRLATFQVDNLIQEKRTIVWQTAWQVFCSYPLLGVGPQNFGNVFSQYAPLHVFIDWQPILHKPATHSMIFSLLAERGLLGTFLWAMVLGTLFINLIYLKKNTEFDYGLKGAIIGYLISMLFIDALYLPQLWVLMGLVVNMGVRVVEQQGFQSEIHGGVVE